MLAIIDYGVGNLYSLVGSLNKLGIECAVTSDINEILTADRIILPGVGAFGAAMDKLNSTGLGEVVRKFALCGKPVLGVCLGMQLLFDLSYEYGTHRGLGLISGVITPLEGVVEAGYKIPHMGWNSLTFKRLSPLFKYVNEGECVYYVHSFYAKNCDKYITAVSDYSISVTGAVQCDNIFGTQFHPEKSGDVGLNILKAFAELE